MRTLPSLYKRCAVVLSFAIVGCAGTSGGSNGTGSSGGSSSGEGGSSGEASSSSGATEVPDGGASGSSSGSSSGGSSSGSSSGGGSGNMPTFLPQATGACPNMSNLNGKVVSFAGQAATVWSGDPAVGNGPLVIYYYATGSNATVEPPGTLKQEQIAAIIARGGAVVAQNKTTAKGTTTGNNVWYTGDVAIADEIVACSIKNQKIDPRRIHVAGYSAGGIQTTHMWYARSGYVASVLTYSGGAVGINVAPIQDAAHPPAAMVTHGGKGRDTYGGGAVDFFDTSNSWVAEIKTAGGFAIDCDDGGGHTDFLLRTKVAPQALQFFLDHPYGVDPKPYATLPAGFPSYCKIR
jgi:hypothetical protein